MMKSGGLIYPQKKPKFDSGPESSSFLPLFQQQEMTSRIMTEPTWHLQGVSYCEVAGTS